MNRITINGTVFETNGRNISVNNGTVIVDGEVIKKGISGSINIIINGDVNQIDCAGSVTVNGSVAGDIDCGGSVHVNENVKGNIDCGGSCNCENVGGHVDAGGSVIMKK